MGSLPLKHMEINGRVSDAIAVLDVVQTYVNSTQAPLEVSLTIPIDKDYALGALSI